MLGAASYDVQLVVLVVLGASLFMIPIFIYMRMTQNRKKEPIVFVSSESARRHFALVWLIRGTGVLLALCSAITAFIIVAGQFERPDIHSWASRILCSVGVACFVLVFGIISKIGCDMFRNLNTTTLANFSFTFAVLLATAWYHLLPPHLPKSIADYFASNSPFVEDYRRFLSYIAFFLFYKLIKAYLMQNLGLNASNPPQNRPPIDPETPEFPRKSPLVQL
jgi:hypothetical protein